MKSTCVVWLAAALGVCALQPAYSQSAAPSKPESALQQLKQAQKGADTPVAVPKIGKEGEVPETEEWWEAKCGTQKNAPTVWPSDAELNKCNKTYGCWIETMLGKLKEIQQKSRSAEKVEVAYKQLEDLMHFL